MNSAVTPAASSYAATSRVDVLDEVGAEQQRVARCEAARHLGEELGACLGREVADRAAEERDDAAPAGGNLVEMVLEVADDRVHLDAVVLAGDRVAAAPGASPR